MRRHLFGVWALLAAGCDGPRPRFDPDLLQDGGAADVEVMPFDASGHGGADGALGDAAPEDATTADSALADAAADDAAPSDAGERDAGAVAPDGAPLDAEVAPDGFLGDAGPDASAGDAAAGDATVVPRAFVTGRAEAADGRTPVQVATGDAWAMADGGAFRLGPLAPGPTRLAFSADGFQTETVDVLVPADGEVELEEDVLLYRGRRVGAGPAERFFFRPDESWLLWEGGGALWASPTGEAAPRALVPREHEVFLGFSPDTGSVVVRRRNRPGLAGDVDLVAIADGATTPLFNEAQPWVRWLGDGRLLAMSQTREALSRLESVRPGEAPLPLAEGVPWLLVTDLADGTVAWAAGAPGDAPRFGVYRGDAAGGEPARLDRPGGAAGSAFLMTTPDRRGLLWLTPEGTLWRWDEAGGARAVADEVRANPRPRFLGDGRLLFWRDGDAPGLADLFDGERLLVAGADPTTFTPVGDRFYAARPGRGLFRRPFAGEGVDLLAGDDVELLLVGGGVLALVDGAAWRDAPDDGAPEPLGVEGLWGLRAAPGGAIAWGPAEGMLWWLPGPGNAAAPTLLVEGADEVAPLQEPGGGALYVLVGGRYHRVPLPPDDGEVVPFDRALRAVDPVERDRLLGLDEEGALRVVSPSTGESRGWALHVDRFARSPRRGFVAYHCDRGVFVVDLGEEPPPGGPGEAP